MQWTALDLKNLAALFDDMADAVLDFRIKHGAALTQLQKNQLTAQFGLLMSCGEQLENEALNTAIADIDSSVADLQNAAHDATSALQKITDVQNAISIAVAAVGLGVAIMNPTPGSLGSSINTLVQAIAQSKAKPTEEGSGAK